MAEQKGSHHKRSRSAKHKDYYKQQAIRTEMNKLRRKKKQERGRAGSKVARQEKAAAYALKMGWPYPGHMVKDKVTGIETITPYKE